MKHLGLTSKLSHWKIKNWFILIDEKKLGPYSLLDLRENPQFTPDTLVCKKGESQWKKARDIEELQEIFDDEPFSKEKDKKIMDHFQTEISTENQATLTLQQDPSQFILWILILLIVLFYSLYHFYFY